MPPFPLSCLLLLPGDGMGGVDAFRGTVVR